MSQHFPHPGEELYFAAMRAGRAWPEELRWHHVGLVCSPSSSWVQRGTAEVDSK